jgi:hypothetical protein
VGRSWKEVKAAKQQINEASGRDTTEAAATAQGVTCAYIVGHQLPEHTEASALGLGSRIAALFADLDRPAFDDLPSRSDWPRAAEFDN